MADYTLMKGDLGQTIKRRLYQEKKNETPNLSTGKITPTFTYSLLPLVSGDTVKLLLKDFTNGTLGTATGGGTCTITDLANSEVTYTVQAADVNAVRTWAMQHEVTKAGTGEVITVPDEPDPINGRTLPYLTVDVLADLG